MTESRQETSRVAAPTSVAAAWPDDRDGDARRRHDWRDTLRNASDLALVGICTTVAAVPLVTAGAAVATASAAIRHWIEHDRWPGVRPMLRAFVRAILPGAVATLVAAVVTALLALNLLALGRGLVPGGPALIAITAALAAGAAGLAGLTVVEIGRRDGRGWLPSVRAAATTAVARPVALVATAGVLALVGVLCALVLPLLAPILAGYALFALHVVARRLRPAT